MKIRSATATPKPPTIELNDIFISVKTTKSNHNNRLDLILNTWQQLAKEQVRVLNYLTCLIFTMMMGLVKGFFFLIFFFLENCFWITIIFIWSVCKTLEKLSSAWNYLFIFALCYGCFFLLHFNYVEVFRTTFHSHDTVSYFFASNFFLGLSIDFVICREIPTLH